MADTPAAGGGNVFTRHIGPLPMWAWTAIVGAVIVGWAWYRNRQSASSAASTANASQVPQFVNQTFTNVQPPSAPDNDTSREGPPGVSRVHRSPEVKHQINQIHKEYEASQDKGTGKSVNTASKGGGTTVHRGGKKPTRHSGPVRRG